MRENGVGKGEEKKQVDKQRRSETTDVRLRRLSNATKTDREDKRKRESDVENTIKEKEKVY